MASLTAIPILNHQMCCGIIKYDQKGLKVTSLHLPIRMFQVKQVDTEYYQPAPKGNITICEGTKDQGRCISASSMKCLDVPLPVTSHVSHVVTLCVMCQHIHHIYNIHQIHIYTSCLMWRKIYPTSVVNLSQFWCFLVSVKSVKVTDNLESMNNEHFRNNFSQFISYPGGI